MEKNNLPYFIKLKQNIKDLNEGKSLTITRLKNRIYIDIQDDLTLDFRPLKYIDYNKKQTIYTDDWNFLSKIIFDVY